MNDSGPTLIGLDAGTTGVTAILFDARLVPLHRAYREFPQAFPAPGRVEHDAGDIFRAVDEVLGEVFARPEAGEVVALGLTNQRETVFALDPTLGEALGPGIVWQDRRTAARCAELRAAGHGELVRARTGLVLDPYFSATKVEWMLAHRPALRERAQGGGVAFGTVDAAILSHLTAQEVFATDPTNASRTMLFDIDAGTWDPELCGLFGVDPSWLPEVRPSTGDFGSTSAHVVGRGVPIRGVAGDQQAALFGQGAFAAGGLKCTFGTGCFLLLHTGTERPAPSPGGLLTTRAASLDGSACFAVEGSVFMGGAIVQWMRDQLGLLASAAESEAVAASVPDAGGAVLVPAFTGLGAPHWAPEARAALLGMTRGTTRAHVVRAGLEAIAAQNAELVELLRSETGLAIDEMLVDGGAAANDLLMGLQADRAGLSVVRPPAVEATARGAAMLAGVSVGLLDPEELSQLLGAEAARFEPRIGAEQRGQLAATWTAAVERVLR